MASPVQAPQPRNLWLLEYVALALRWLEELLSLLNGPVLMFGAGVAIVDLLTDGALTLAVPALLFAWAVSQALGIDTQLLGCFARAREALREQHVWAIVGWLALGLILAYFAWQAGYVFAVQQSQHISEAAALAQLGIPAAIWLGERAALAVGLVALSGWTRYHPPAKSAAPAQPIEAADARAHRQQAEIERARHRAELRAIGVGGLRQAVLAAAGKVDPLHASHPLADEPTSGDNEQGHGDGDGGDGGGSVAGLPAEMTGTDGMVVGGNSPRQGASGGKAARITRIPRRPRGLMTASDLAGYVLDHFGRQPTDDEVLGLVKTIPGAARLDAEKGQPWAAPKAALIQRARQLWADVPAGKAAEA